METSQSLERFVGQGLWRVRLRRGLTRAALAKVAGITAPKIKEYEMGKRRIPAHHLLRITVALGVEIGSVFRGSQAFDASNDRLQPG